MPKEPPKTKPAPERVRHRRVEKREDEDDEVDEYDRHRLARLAEDPTVDGEGPDA
jgi:hypothetical protein